MNDDVFEAAAVADSLKPRRSLRYDLPSVMAEQERQSRRLLLLVIRSVFIVLLVTVTVLTIASEKETINEFGWSTVWGLILAATAVGVIVLVVDTMTPNKRLSTVVGAYMGICFGLIGAVAIGALIDIVADAWEIGRPPLGDVSRAPLYLGLAKVVIGIVLCYLSVSVVLTTKDDFRLVIPYVEFAKQVRGVRPLLVDTSALIDGRINDLGHTGFFDAPIIVPRFVIDELQTLADSSDKLKRSRGRRGLDMVSKIQANPFLDVTIDDPIVEGLSVDKMLIELARTQKLRILTTDYNLKKVAQIHNVAVLNINDLANTLKTSVVPGESIEVTLVKPGENPTQGVGYLADGTMVVVEDASEHIGETVSFVVTNSLQTSAGRMIFGKLEAPEPGTAANMARAATTQPRTIERPAARTDATGHGRSPRR
ncbi:MAG: hypothetical protein KDA22_01575 [Phycisphaerales bacterium]|nr:hypothetical protein [Phycisphaerales bacterium]